MIISLRLRLLIRRVILFTIHEYCLELEVMSINSYKISFLLLIDFISVFFFGTVILISRRVIIFSSSYISADKYSARFIFIVVLFVMRIRFLIFSPRIIRLLLGWDGLGVTSYLLVCYYRSEKRFNARILTVITNRLGDVIILFFIALNTTPGLNNFCLMNSQSNRFYCLVILIIIARITKRAQVPFSAWLPAAIAAPTPVSALVHSSTLVTAGVYLMVRFNYVLITEKITTLLAWVGALTMLIAGLAALIEIDIKKIIALSTLSQLGVIVFTLGLGERLLCWFHLIRHAYFKAMLFIGAGAAIHRVKDYQDIRKIGSWVKNNYWISRIFLIRRARLCGMPFMRGFYSKDSILERILIIDLRLMLILLAIVATLATASYSIRVMKIVFISFSLREAYSLEGDRNSRLGLGIVPLFLPSIIGGWILFSFSIPNLLVVLPLWLKLIIITLILITFVITFQLIQHLSPRILRLSGIHQMWFLPNLLRTLSTKLGLRAAKSSMKVQESSWVLFIIRDWIISKPVNNYSASLYNTRLISALLVIIIVILIQF